MSLLLILDTNIKIIISLFWCIIYLFKSSCSGEGANCGNFLSGVGTIGLVILGVLGFNKWKKEKAAERFSNIAEESLKSLNIFKEKFLHQLSLVIIDLAFLDDQNVNKEAYYKIIKDLALVANIKEFDNAKDIAERLKHNEINKKFKDLSCIVNYFSMIDVIYLTKNFSPEDFKIEKLFKIMTQFKEKRAEIKDELNNISCFSCKIKV
ncbi:MAG: hypothetical protein ABIA74_05985 [bacterium]